MSPSVHFWSRVLGSLRMLQGAIYRFTLQIVKRSATRPQIQFGVHGMKHNKPWRLITTTRSSRSRDDEPWQDRPHGDRCIHEGDFIHIQVDCRGPPEERKRQKRKPRRPKVKEEDGAKDEEEADLKMEDFEESEGDEDVGQHYGTLSYCINDENWEIAFEDVPISYTVPIMPIVSMGGKNSCVKVCWQ
eukprot:Platyproteum_vivax@DN7510_c0_g1_i5.p1